jgi:hypothetical protein
MRAERLVALFLLLLSFASCAIDPHAEATVDIPSEQHASVFGPWATPTPDLLDLDLIQRTCALYVAVRSSAWDGPIAFGRDIDDSMVHWNLCPGGNMVACVKTPSAAGDTIITGIPLPYEGEKKRW